MRVLLLITDLEIGGTPTVVRELAIRLRGAGVEAEVACLGRWGPVADQLRDANVPVTALGACCAMDVRIVPRLVELLRRGGFDVVFSFLIHANALAAGISSLFPNVRFIQSIQTTQPWPGWHWRLQRLIALVAERIVVPSESVKRAAMEWSGVPAEQVVVIPNAVEVSDEATKRRSDEGGGGKVVGFIGRLDPVKRVPDLLEAMSMLKEARLEIFGEGLERAAIERRIGQLGLADRVTLHGAVGRPEDALSQIDVLVLPSEAEGFGLVLIEAMTAGVPVVATDVPGIRDVVRDGQTGLLVPVRRPAELAAAIARVMDDRALREKLVINAYANVKSRFSWRVALPAYLEIIGVATRSPR